jgi:hypothetical protein
MLGVVTQKPNRMGKPLGPEAGGTSTGIGFAYDVTSSITSSFT